MNRYDLVLLGFILEQDRCGYDIITAIRERDMERWAKISVSTIYNRLSRLESKGYITGRSEQNGNRPERMTYAITDIGKSLVAKQVIRHLVGFNDDPRTLGFAFLFAAEPQEVVNALRVHESKLMREIEVIEDMIQKEPKPTLHEEGPFLNCMSRDHMKVELKYVRSAMRILQQPNAKNNVSKFFGINFGARPLEVL
jgi:DNA-binding PadR family transcriptional regulator